MAVVSRPSFRIACCLCRKPVPLAKDVHALDAEWKRRFPEMLGTLACPTCAISSHQWSCRKPDGSLVHGHRPAARKDECFDSWDHIEEMGTHVAMVLAHPASGVVQGAEAYLRSAVRRPSMDTEVAAGIQAALDQHGADHGSRRAPADTTGTRHGRSAVPGACPMCAPDLSSLHNQSYDHLHWEKTLPRQLHTDGYTRRRGYAVSLSGSIQHTWVFFADLEPALVFGRAGRMSSVDIRSYGVYPAVHELKFDEQARRAMRTLYVQDRSIDRQPDEQQAFRRWLAGTTLSSSHFQP